MSLLDRYVGRIVLGAFAAAMLFFLFLGVVMHLLGNLSRFIDRAGNHGVGGLDLAVVLGGYYTKMLPVLFVTITPFVTVIAGMFAVGRLLSANEVVPMLFVGRSSQRVLRPLLLCGACAGAAMAACWQWIVPHVGPAIAEAEAFLNDGTDRQKCLVDESGDRFVRRLFVPEYFPARRRMHDVVMLAEGVLDVDTALVVAKVGTWDEHRRDWRLEGGTTRVGREELPREWLERPDLTPDVLLQRSRQNLEPELLSYGQLLETIELRPNSPKLRHALHRHITYPLACLVLLLLALPLAVWFERGSRVGRLLVAIGLCGAYLLFDLTCQSLGQRGLWHPVVAAWSPTIVFGSLGVVLYGSVRT